MELNDTFSSNGSLFAPPSSCGSTQYTFMFHCLFSSPSRSMFAAYTITNMLLILPVSILILYLAFRQWRRRRPGSAAAMTSHTIIFTDHMAAMELISTCGNLVCYFGICICSSVVAYVGFFFISFTWYGKMFVHLLTCAERYLAVVHPVTYLGLKTPGGIKIRNISIGCVWLFCFGVAVVIAIRDVVVVILDFLFLCFSLIVITFCSVSVLCVLIRPGPGEVGRDREQVNQSKQRASYTIMAILGTLSLRFAFNMIWTTMFAFPLVSNDDQCVMSSCQIWLNLPSSLVLPLLFLQRAGKPRCLKS